MTRPRSFQEEFPVTAFLLLFNLAFFALEFIANSKGQHADDGFQAMLHPLDVRVLESLGALFPPKVARGEYWRLISCTFLHSSIVHLAFNGFFLFSFGRIGEPLLSRWRFLSIYVVCGIGSSLTSLLLQNQNSLSTGASGALCGLLGALFGHSIRHDDRLLRDSLTSTIVFIIFVSTFPNVDWAGHLGGFVVGFAFGWFTSAYTTSTAAARWRYPGYAAVILAAGSLIMALRNHFLGGAAF